MVAVVIGIDPHKASHTAVAIDPAEVPLGQLRVRACAAQAERLLGWAQAWPQRTWAVEGAGGVGHLPAQQLLSAGERVADVPPKLAARVRLLATGNINKNDPNDARSVAVAALRSAGVREACRDDHAAVLKVWSKRYQDLGRARTQVACRLHQVLCELIPGGAGAGKEITAGQAALLLGSITPAGAGAVAAARWELAAEFTEDLRGAGRPDPPDQEEARRGGAGGRDQPDRAVWSRPGRRRRGHRRRARRVPLSGPGSLRRLQRHRPHRGVLRRPQDLAAVPARQQKAQPRHPYGRGHPDPLPAQPGPRLLRQETGRRQDPQGSPALPEAANQRCHLRLPASRRRPGSRGCCGQRAWEGNGGTALSPARPGHTPSTGSSGKPLPGPQPAYDPSGSWRPRSCSLSRSAAIPCERAAGSRTGPGPDAQRNAASLSRCAGRQPVAVTFGLQAVWFWAGMTELL
jgi:hypothetical protein